MSAAGLPSPKRSSGFARAGIEARLARASAVAVSAREALAAGRTVDLTGLAEIVDAACREIVQAPGADAQALRLRVVALYDELDRLTDALQHEHDTLKRALGDLSAQQRARSAYGKPGRDGG